MHQSNTPLESVRLWDAPTRLFHWTLVALVAALFATGWLGKLDGHMKLGAAVLALLAFRLMWGVIGSRTARFSHFLAGPRTVLDYLRAEKLGRPWPHLGHNPMGGWSVVALMTLLTVQAASGLFANDDVATDGPLVWLVSSKTTALLSSVHRIGVKALLALVALHLGAIAFHRFAKGDDLVTPMLTGTKAVPAKLARTLTAADFRGVGLALAALAVASVAVAGPLVVWGRW